MCLFICSCSYKDNREDYNFLEDNSIRFIKNDTGIILLINKNDILYTKKIKIKEYCLVLACSFSQTGKY